MTAQPPEARLTGLTIPLDQLPTLAVDDNGWVLAPSSDPAGGRVNLGHTDDDPAAAWDAALRALAFAVHLAPGTTAPERMDIRRALDVLTGVRPATAEELGRARRLVAAERERGALLHLDGAVPGGRTA